MSKTIRIGGKIIDFDEPKIMGVINVTPDSFYSGSRHISTEDVFLKVEKMLEEGADFIDLGAMSSRPGAQIISSEEEKKRLSNVVPELKKRFPDAIFSIDTLHAETAEYALDHGFEIVNDISGGNYDPNMFRLITDRKIPYILMHMRGTPSDMQQHTHYDHLIEELIRFFASKIEKFHQHGFYDVIIDPGFGFSKTLEQNYQLLHHLDVFKILEKPILVGVSRKSMIFRLLETTPDEALEGTLVVETIALLKGANILRVHDVKPTKDLITIVQSYQKAALPS